MILFDEICDALHGLSARELRDLKTQIGALLGLGGPAVLAAGKKNPSNTVAEETLVLRAICVTLGRMTGAEIAPHQISRNAAPRMLLREHLPNLMKYLESIDEGSRYGFLEIAVGMLAENIRLHLHLPLTLTIVIQQLPRLPAVVDNAFPGYYQFGLLNMIVRARKGQSR